MEFKTKKAWEAFVDKGISEGKTPQQMNKLAGTYDGPEGRFTVHQKKGSKRRWEPVNLAVRAKRDKKRITAGQEQDQIMLDTLKKGGLSDKEAKAILAREKAGYKKVERQAKRWTDDPDIPGDYQAGHRTAVVDKGGVNYGRNVEIEIGKSRIRPDGTKLQGNQSRGNRSETPDPFKPVTGTPRSGRGGRDTALINLLQINERSDIMDLDLTPKNIQDILNSPNTDVADDIIEGRQQQVKAIEEVKASGKPPSKSNVLRIARMTAPMWLSLPLGATAAVQSAKAAVQDPTAHNIEDAGWDTANLTVDALSLVPFLAAPMEGAQKLLGIAHQARMAARDLENLEIK